MPMFDAPEWMRGKPDKRDETDEHYWEVELTAKQRFALLDVLNERKKPPVGVVKGIINAVASARRVNMPLIRERLNWSELELEAKRQGVSAVEILWDRAKGRGD